MKMKSMVLKGAEKSATDDADGEPATYQPGKEGIELTLENHHIKQLGMDHPMPVGTKVSMQHEGEVTESSSRTDDDGNPVHHMRLTMHRAGIDGDEDRGGDLRIGIKELADKQEGSRANKDAGRVFGKAATDKKGG